MRRCLPLLLLAACGSPSGDGSDAGAADAQVEPDAATCTTPAACDWIEAYLREIVGKLSGETEIAPGVTLTARESVAERDAVRDYIDDELTRLGYAPVRQDFVTGANVIATRPGTGALLVVGAHFDGVADSPAAADDGTGTAVVLAAARYFRAVAHDRPIAFALFDSEEVGLVGSTKYADQLVVDGTDVLAAHCYDMISFDGDGDRAIELWSPSPSLVTLYTDHATPLGIPVRTVTFASSDHQSFLADGFVATGIGEEFVSGDHTPHYHQPTDTYDKIDFTYLTDMTELAFEVLQDQATD